VSVLPFHIAGGGNSTAQVMVEAAEETIVPLTMHTSVDDPLASRSSVFVIVAL
jgi:hypothetical protein